MEQDIDKLVYIIIPVHNRQEITFTCLNQLKELGYLQKYQIVVVDDGSTDGTPELVARHFPEVQILFGDGNLWWTGAVVKGMQYAHSQGAEYLIWLNDDTLPSSGTIPLMLDDCFHHPNHIISAQCYSSSNLQHPTYGGHKKYLLSSKLVFTPPDKVAEVDFLSGNLVCFPRSVIDTIGYPPCQNLPHCLADIAYTWQAKIAGYKLKVIGSATAVCSFNPFEEGWTSSPIPMRTRWKQLSTLKSNMYPPAFWFFCRKTYGLFAAVVFIRMYSNLLLFTVLRAIFPNQILKKIKFAKDTLFKQQVDQHFLSSFLEAPNNIHDEE